jgi:transcription elongation GreA/GreB family factor
MKSVDKKKLIDQICAQLERDLQAAKVAAQATYEAATGEESKAENEYDTRGLEASYLAGAQAKRVGEIEEQLNIYRHLEIKEYNDDTPIQATALIQVEANGKELLIFLMPKGGGLSITFEGQKIQIVTPASPLGEALFGRQVGDLAIVENASSSKEYEILSVC